jgi:hypothetical protein
MRPNSRKRNGDHGDACGWKENVRDVETHRLTGAHECVIHGLADVSTGLEALHHVVDERRRRLMNIEQRPTDQSGDATGSELVRGRIVVREPQLSSIRLPQVDGNRHGVEQSLQSRAPTSSCRCVSPRRSFAIAGVGDGLYGRAAGARSP